MKLAYLANIRLPTEKAHGAQIMNMCAAFASQKRGMTQTNARTYADETNDVTLVVPWRLNMLKDDPFVFYGVPRNFSIRKIFVADFLALPFLKQLGFVLESMSFIKALWWHLLFNTYDAYYTRDLAVAAGLWTRTPLFYEIHSLPERGNWLHRRAWRRAKGIVVISDGLRKALIAFGVPEQKILLARDAVDMKKFYITATRDECRAKLNLPADKKIVVYTGHLYDWKGADVLAGATAELPPDTRVYIVGGTVADTEAFRRRFVSANLHVLGWRNSSEIPLWLKAADVLVLPTSGKTAIGARYTSPMKLFEYMASATPIVASDLPSIREVLQESQAIFVRPDDPLALAGGIAAVLHNEHGARLVALAAQEHVREYSWENRARNIINFIGNF